MTKYLSAAAIVFSVTIVAFTYLSKESRVSNPDLELISLQNLSEIPPVPSEDKYGFLENGDVEVVKGKIQQNESFYILMNRHGVSPQQIYQIQQQVKESINLNRMMPGQSYRIYKQDGRVLAFVWHQSRTQFATISMDERIEFREDSLPVERKTNYASGIISSSLYETVINRNSGQYLGSALADIFAWEIDFFSLRTGDHFKTIHEELYVDGEYIGLGEIKAAEFQHRGEVKRAYYFNNGTRRGYFDEDGNSLQKDLLKAPFRYSQRISSGFSQNRFHPILKERRPHHGTDYAAPTGTPILAVGDGVVIEAQRRAGNGNIIQIRHNSTYKTAYLHLNGFASGIKKGAAVTQGQVIGYVGSTGLATGPHLCYRIYVNDRPVNSQRVELPASDALDEEYMEEFFYVVKELEEKLNAISLSGDSMAFN